MGRTREEKLADYVREGAVPKVKAYLRKHQRLDVNKSADHKQRTLLHLVCANGDDATARLLLKYGADPALQDSNGDTAIHVALQKVLYGYKHAFKDLVIPLLKHSPRGSLDLANKKGRTARQLLEESDHKLKQEEEAQFDEQRQKQSCSFDNEEDSWQEKLFQEMQGDCGADDEYFPFWQGHSESNYESYDSWAERMSQEHKHKHNPGPLPSAKHKKKKRDAKPQHTDHTKERFAWDRARNKKHEKDKDKSERLQKKLIVQKMDYLERCKHVFDTGADKKLGYDDVPWPKNSRNVDSMVQVLICDVDRSNEDDFKKFLRTQRLIWHPDKFVQKLGERLMPVDRDRILKRVTELSQALNKIGAQEET